MHFSSTLIYALVAIALHAVDAINVKVPAGDQRCFFEVLEKGDNIRVSFQVAEGGHLDVDFSLTDPNKVLVEDTRKSSSDTYNHEVKLTGKHVYCFSNSFSTVTEKQVSFNIQVIKPHKEEDTQKKNLLEVEIRDLAIGIEDIKNEQEYTIARERTHRDTAESTNSRVVWWSLFQSAILFIVCVFQITYLKRFFEVKRVV
ncbi:p24 complex component [Podila minutissima]|uniref:P24 complex component n=1 Tax=Podila minutissima TaxID=64525 RepID=A0A9P5VG83_9FUNG|nr:p24 complex component [Podila minutissima]